MILESLKGLYDEIGEEKLTTLLNTFNCASNRDVNDFIKTKAIRFHKSGLARTYLIVNDSAEIMAYYAIAFKPIFYNQQIHKVSKSSFKKLNAKIYQLRKANKVEVINSILIAQIGRNDLFTKDDIDINSIMSSIIDTIKKVRDLIGTRVVLIEVDNNEKLINLYKKIGFEYIGVQDNLSQLYQLQVD